MTEGPAPIEAIEPDRIRTPLPEKPELRYIFKSMQLLQGEEGEGGKNWRELAEHVAPWENALELVHNVRDVVAQYVSTKIPKLKSEIPTIGDFDDKALSDALSHGWFETLKKEDGTPVDVFKENRERRGVLLSVLTHVVRGIEKKTIKDILKSAPENNLEKLGLTPDLRDLSVELLDISLRADPLFIRYFAYAKLSGEPEDRSDRAKGDAFKIPGQRKLQTIRSMFPHETQYLARHFRELSEKDADWKRRPGGETFGAYLQALSQYYEATDPVLSKKYRLEANKLISQYVQEGFPLLLTNTNDTAIKNPFNDPEHKVALLANVNWDKIQKTFAQHSNILGIKNSEKKVLSQPVKAATVLGSYGVNLVFNSVDQAEPPVTFIFLDEQGRSFDKELPGIIESYIHGVDSLFGIEYMSQTSTVMHALGHWVGTTRPAADDGSVEDMKTEAILRALTPQLLKDGVLKGTPEQWTAAHIGGSIQLLKDNLGDKTNDYFRAAVYAFNDQFETGSLELIDGKVHIKDVNAYYAVALENALNILSLYKDPDISVNRINKWVQKHGRPNEKTAELISLIEGKQTVTHAEGRQ